MCFTDFATHRLFGMKIPNKLLIFWENTHTTAPKQSQLGQNSREKGWGTKGRGIQLQAMISFVLESIFFLLFLFCWKRGKWKINFYRREQNRAPNAKSPSNSEVGKGVRRSQNIRCTPLHLEHPRQEFKVLIFQNFDHSDCNLTPAHNESPDPIFLVETNTNSTLWSLHTHHSQSHWGISHSHFKINLLLYSATVKSKNPKKIFCLIVSGSNLWDK